MSTTARLPNVCTTSSAHRRYEEAAYIRELFDEPATVLYQVWTLIRTIDDAAQPDAGIPTDALIEQTDKLILEVVHALDDDREAAIVQELMRLRQGLVETGDADSRPVDKPPALPGDEPG
jgi:hypothetical protein